MAESWTTNKDKIVTFTSPTLKHLDKKVEYTDRLKGVEKRSLILSLLLNTCGWFTRVLPVNLPDETSAVRTQKCDPGCVLPAFYPIKHKAFSQFLSWETKLLWHDLSQCYQGNYNAMLLLLLLGWNLCHFSRHERWKYQTQLLETPVHY